MSSRDWSGRLNLSRFFCVRSAKRVPVFGRVSQGLRQAWAAACLRSGGIVWWRGAADGSGRRSACGLPVVG